jgi:hypothetical protein
MAEATCPILMSANCPKNSRQVFSHFNTFGKSWQRAAQRSPDGFHLPIYRFCPIHFTCTVSPTSEHKIPYHRTVVARWLGLASNATADRRWPAQTPISVKAATHALRHFVGLMETLPAEQAAPLWQVTRAQAASKLDADPAVAC